MREGSGSCQIIFVTFRNIFLRWEYAVLRRSIREPRSFAGCATSWIPTPIQPFHK